MKELHLFTDGSVDTKSKVGYGAYLLVTETDVPLDRLSGQIEVQRFAQTSSTRLELQTLLWALGEIETSGSKLTVYSDSQNIVDLPVRRKRLEQSSFHSKQNRPLNNSQLYQEFYRLTDQLDCQFVKVHGHRPTLQKNTIDKMFALVDRASRKALREDKKPTAQTTKED